MTLGQLRRMIAARPASDDACEVKVWLPGSRISLCGAGFAELDGRVLAIEGNLDRGSVLR